MRYNVVLTEQANEHLENIIKYVVENFCNNVVATGIINDAEITYKKLEIVAGSLCLCEDSYLAAKGYRKIIFNKHNYLMLYQIRDNNVYINGIFHMLENYVDKL